MQLWRLYFQTKRIRAIMVETSIVNGIVHLYSSQGIVAIIEHSTLNDCYEALKVHVGQTVIIQTINYYIFSRTATASCINKYGRHSGAGCNHY
jgi:hypothetical protein